MAAVVAATNGQSTILGSAGGQYTFADRYGYIAVTNLGTAAISVTADGSNPEAAVAAGTGVSVPAGATKVIANGLPLWYQSSRVIPAGVSQVPFGNGATKPASSSVASTPAQPGENFPYMTSGWGSQGAATNNPGTNINVSSGATSFSLEGTG